MNQKIEKNQNTSNDPNGKEFHGESNALNLMHQNFQYILDKIIVSR